MPEIENGYIKLARVIKSSDIFTDKPSWWFKVWCHILMKVNHKNGKQFNRAQQFFNMQRIYEICHLKMDKIKPESVDNVIRWLRTNKMITTQQTKRGVIITVCNYTFYQDGKKYKNDAENETKHKRSINEVPNEAQMEDGTKQNGSDDVENKEKRVLEEIYERYKK